MASKKGVAERKKAGEETVGKKSLLKEAIADIDKELERLNKEKISLKKQLDGIDVGVESARELERKLQEKLSQLLREETKLYEHKRNTQKEIGELSDKLGKIKKIKSEISEV